MPDLIYAPMGSLDGYLNDADGGFDWAEPAEDAHELFNELQAATAIALLGRRMYEVMRFWDSDEADDMPPVGQRFTAAWRDTDKVVYSTTLTEVTEPRTRLERTFDPDAVRALVDAAPGDVSIAGAELAGQALRAGIVDRLILVLHPVIVGGGSRMLPDGVRTELTLTEVRRFDSGPVLLDYRRA